MLEHRPYDLRYDIWVQSTG